MKDEEGLFNRACSNRTRSNGFKLAEGRFKLDIRMAFFAMKNTGTGCPKGGRCPIPGNIQGQVGRCFDVPAHAGAVGLDDL